MSLRRASRASGIFPLAEVCRPWGAVHVRVKGSFASPEPRRLAFHPRPRVWAGFVVGRLCPPQSAKTEQPERAERNERGNANYYTITSFMLLVGIAQLVTTQLPANSAFRSFMNDRNSATEIASPMLT